MYYLCYTFEIVISKEGALETRNMFVIMFVYNIKAEQLLSKHRSKHVLSGNAGFTTASQISHSNRKPINQNV